ncbi:ABC transporter ATP-binding protein [Wenjunlia tyrosinilytica]|jgi:sulfonate transport system ATP-binding protein|uniref:Aliphatic sulfonates import ATP-binding protein SsuB 2 n=1 Tax=Wenjunlia tyrosinilytica TaxID=1544741 RepID=A0A918DYV6_9ACTN|nr:ABC transporter ATP-binding protein [Wenjunlia tyrosinilytica]GGO93415.1 aliphatic sulfonates import ATP-binding protein SsuB 2 [Wenjunlia tyrosinilytica]
MSAPVATRHRRQAGAVVDKVVRRFGDRVVLDHLDLTIADEELVVLLGPSGCGKSTLLRLLAGLDRPDGGLVEVPAKRAIVFQADRLLPWQRVLRNVTLGLRGPDAQKRGREVLAEVGLSGREGAWPKELSGGEAQRVSLARALVSEPELVLLDEPFAALDAITRLRMHDLVRALRSKHHAAMLLVTHDVDEAIALADRVVVMRDGRIGASHHLRLSAAEREASVAREELRSTLLEDLGLAHQH